MTNTDGWLVGSRYSKGPTHVLFGRGSRVTPPFSNFQKNMRNLGAIIEINQWMATGSTYRYGDSSASDRTHRLSPALCKKAKEDNVAVWVTAQTESGAKALKCSLNGVLTACSRL